MQIVRKKVHESSENRRTMRLFLTIIEIYEEVRIMPTTKGPLHPSVQQFKEFVNHHPKMVHEVRSGHKTWQQFYEEWYLLGEEDPIWATFRPDGAPAYSSVKENKKKR